VARVLIVGCGCRGIALGRALSGEHVVRGTTRSPDRLPELEAAGIEGVVADPDRLATLVPAVAGVTVVCWLMGSADAADLHGARLETFLEHVVDTPVRGFVYEAAGTANPSLLQHGAQLVRTASQTWRIRSELVTADPADHEAWLGAAKEAVERTVLQFPS
jgi:uncharacterized protein YbjT (DUF2867 family)